MKNVNLCKLSACFFPEVLLDKPHLQFVQTILSRKVRFIDPMVFTTIVGRTCKKRSSPGEVLTKRHNDQTQNILQWAFAHKTFFFFFVLFKLYDGFRCVLMCAKCNIFYKNSLTMRVLWKTIQVDRYYCNITVARRANAFHY